TIGANGFLIRRGLLKLCSIDDYLFDIDIVYELVSQGKNKFAKVKTGIIHIFSGSVSTFARKQRRRIKDYAYYKKLDLRVYPWSETDKKSLLKFFLYDILVVPLLAQALKGYSKKSDISWFFHLPACWVTLIVYGWGTVRNVVKVEEEDRGRWGRV
ncbi:MAG: hypothetical protein SVO01_07755, partial [Thermotogota bacterium]|nr:hypothetical protein [Thermotogota bacterium]